MTSFPELFPNFPEFYVQGKSFEIYYWAAKHHRVHSPVAFLKVFGGRLYSFIGLCFHVFCGVIVIMFKPLTLEQMRDFEPEAFKKEGV